MQILPNGPILNALVGVSAARAHALQLAGQPIPQAIGVQALIDTGADGTCIDRSVLTTLGLTPTGSVKVRTPSTGAVPHEADQYDVGLLVPGATTQTPPLMISNLAVLCAELFQPQGFHALIGRDILARCLFTYNGDTGLFTLAY
jgi:hypothetical protein